MAWTGPEHSTFNIQRPISKDSAKRGEGGTLPVFGDSAAIGFKDSLKHPAKAAHAQSVLKFTGFWLCYRFKFMTKLPISVCIVAGNEAHRIRPALESVKDWTSEIILAIDDGVKDGTDKIAAEYGAKVVSQPWRGHAAHRNFASDHATQPWLLAVDADEVVSEKLRGEIIARFQNHGVVLLPAAYSFPRLSYFGGRWIRHGDWYPDRKVRLWRKAAGKWEGDPHEKLVLQGAVIRLRADLFHYSNENIDQMLGKIGLISTIFVRQCQGGRRSVGWADLAIRPFWKFFRAYVIRLGFLDGWPGYFIAWINAFSTVTRYAKVIEHTQQAARKPE
jgi:glycosyltransferase involved in cell wall biosynthesis